MIEVVVHGTTKNGKPQELAYIKIERLESDDLNTGDYVVEFAVERVGAIGFHRRMIYGFPRTKYNVLGLLRQALSTLEMEELETESETGSSDLEREVRGIGAALPREASNPVRHHRSPFWR